MAVDPDNPDDLPIARPVDPADAKLPPRSIAPGIRTAATTGPTEPPAKPRVFAACCIMGVLALLGLAAAGFLLYVTLTILGEVGQQLTDDDGAPGDARRGSRPGPVGPTKLEKARDRFDLSGPVDAVARGANGRFLVLRVPSKSELAVFDPVEAKVIRTLAVGESASLFGASAGKLYVYRPQAGVLERYDLLTWAKERTLRPNLGTPPEALLVGPGSNGPVFLLSPTTTNQVRVSVRDPDTLAEIALYPVVTARSGGVPTHFRISADGQWIGVATGPADAPSAAVFRHDPVTGYKLATFPAKPTFGRVTPDADGRFIYTARGVFDTEAKPVLKPAGDFFYTFPTAHPSDLFVSLGVSDAGRLTEPIRLHLAGDRAALADLSPQVEEPRGLDATDTAELPGDQRVHVWPAAGLVAVLSSSGKTGRIEMYKVDMAAALRKSGKDHFLIGSLPPTTAVRGTTWEYRPTVWASGSPQLAGEVKTGPVEMAVTTANGLAVTWPVPANFPDADGEVHLQVTDGTGRSATQKFRLAVIDGPGG